VGNHLLIAFYHKQNFGLIFSFVYFFGQRGAERPLIASDDERQDEGIA